jgi:glyoxylase-like metal-dependent hydrolase (beta-lactamase superfamily II)
MGVRLIGWRDSGAGFPTGTCGKSLGSLSRSDGRTLPRTKVGLSLGLGLLVAGLLVSGSAAALAQDAHGPTQPLEIGASPRSGAPDIERLAFPGGGSVNTYVLRAPEGLIVIDFQRDVDSARAVVEHIKGLERPVAALLLTHAHPDHIGGIEQFKRAFPNAPLYASQATINELRSDSLGYQKLTREVLGKAAPGSYPLPERVLRDRQRLRLAGLELEVREMGAGEATSATVVYLPASRDLVLGDVAITGMTDFLLEGRTGPWLRQLAALRAAYPRAKWAFPGHGRPMPAADLLRHQKAFLTFVRTAAAEQIRLGRTADGRLSEAGRSAVAEAVRRRFGSLPPVALIPRLEELNADAVARELLRRPDAPTR